MNKVLFQGILVSKICSASERAGMAELRGDHFKARELYHLALVAARMYAHGVSQDAKTAREKLSEVRRTIRKAEKAGVTTTFGAAVIQRLEREAKAADKLVILVGENIINLLDAWQRVGAGLTDLCALCGIPYETALQKVKPERREERLTAILYITELDDRYPDRWNRGYPYDAPLSFAVQEFFTHFMTHTDVGRKAAHEALEAFFPEIYEHAVRIVTDADGIQRVIDADGVEIGTVGEEE